jgi:hypothetical protein
MKKITKQNETLKKLRHFFASSLFQSRNIILAISLLLNILFLIPFINAHKEKIKQTIILATTYQPERFTELYFENHLNLPKDTTLNTPKTFAFTIHNLEYRTETYPYEIYIPNNGQKQIIATGTATLNQDQYKTIHETFTLTTQTKRAHMVVNLKNKDQQIAFWMGENEEKETAQAASTKTLQQAKPTPIYVPDFFLSNQIPLVVTTNQIIPISFTVRNTTLQLKAYPYTISLEENGQSTPIETNQFTLQPGEKKRITTSYTLPHAITHANIIIKLLNENRYIYTEMKGSHE